MAGSEEEDPGPVLQVAALLTDQELNANWPVLQREEGERHRGPLRGGGKGGFGVR